MKKRLGSLRIEATLYDGLYLRVKQTDLTVNALIERYIADGLARDNGTIIETSALPHIREAVREEVNGLLAQVSQRLTADLTKAARRTDDRLAALIVKAVRHAGLAQHMMFALLSKLAGRSFADQTFAHARETIGKELARKSQEEEEVRT